MTTRDFVRVLARLGEKAVTEYRFAPPHRWRFDIALPERMVAIEIEGGIWTRGRHTRGKGFLGDIRKYNEATILGWRLLRYTPEMFDGMVPLADLARMGIIEEKKRCPSGR